MDTLLLGFPVALLAAGALWVFHRRRTRLREVFEDVVRRGEGRLERGPWGLYPVAVLPAGDVELWVSGVHGSRHGRAACSFVWIPCAQYPELALDLRRKPRRVGALERLGQEEASTGHGEFDRAFWMHVEGGDAARELLDRELREALLAFAPEDRVRLRIGELPSFPDGWRSGVTQRGLEVSIRRLPPSAEDVEALVELARRTHDRLVAAARADAA